VVKPFVIDLESTNGTHVNGEAIPPARFYELKMNDGMLFWKECLEISLIFLLFSYQVWSIDERIRFAQRECCGIK
jgi:pSer/pThr/pTyr-binding forkhead associated (FHA) protein